MTLMRKTLKECKARGERTQEAGFRRMNASMLNGGWYEKRASDFTLRVFVSKEMTRENVMHGYPSIVVIVYWKRYYTLWSGVKTLINRVYHLFGGILNEKVVN